MDTEKPFAPACERNRDPILAALEQWLPTECRILEIGSGTGQHAAHFCANQPDWTWQCSDLAENLPGITRWLEDLTHLQPPPPLALDVSSGPWPSATYDAVFTSNTLHIMPFSAVEALFEGLTGVIAPEAQFITYGPFNYRGRHTSESNAAFDEWLRERAGHQGIRDFEAIDALAQAAGLALLEDRAMPANNRLLRYQRK